MKQSQDRLADPWEIDIDLYVEKGMAPEWARVFTINSWTYAGDLRPLRAELAQPKLGQAFLALQILQMFAKLMDEDRLTVKPPGDGRPSPPDKFSRDVAAAWFYEDEIAAGKSSEEAFNVVSQKLGMTYDSVRNAVTWFRKNWNAQ